jgi:hypothetical protein
LITDQLNDAPIIARARLEISEGRSERDTQDQSAREFIDACLLRESIHLPAPR